jgi:hypothetical protein
LVVVVLLILSCCLLLLQLALALFPPCSSCPPLCLRFFRAAGYEGH